MQSVKFIVLISFMVSACTKAPPTQPSSGNPPAPVLTPVTEQARAAAFQSIEHLVDSLPWTDHASCNGAILNAVRAMPQIASAGISDSGQNVWAMFADGRYWFIANNMLGGGDTSDAVVKGIERTPLSDPPNDLPQTKNVLIVNSMGNNFSNPIPVLSWLFGLRGHTVTTSSGSVDDLMNISGYGVMFIRAHGALHDTLVSDTSRSASYGLWTSTLRTSLLDAIYNTVLSDGELCYFTAYNNNVGGVAVAETHYAITPKFVVYHFSIPTTALIYIDACTSMEFTIRNAFLRVDWPAVSNTHRAYIGWTLPAQDGPAYIVEKFFFDRMLGTNVTNLSHVPVESPYQRPFDLIGVFADISKRNLDVCPSTGALLRYAMTDNSGFSPILDPSIERLEVFEESDELHLVGMFGTKQPTVTVNGATLQVEQHDVNDVVCKIPKSGPGSAGNVIVTVDGHQSNVVQLTEWYLPVHLVVDSYGSLHENFDGTLHIRADVHMYRTKPGTTPLPADPFETIAVLDSKGVTSAGGSGSLTYVAPISGCTITEWNTWSMSPDSIPASPLGGNGLFPGFNTILHFFPSSSMLSMSIVGSSPNANQYVDSAQYVCPDLPNTSTMYSGSVGFSFATPGDTVAVHLDDKFKILSGGVDSSTYAFMYGPGSRDTTAPPRYAWSVHWDAATPNYPPADTSGHEIGPVNIFRDPSTGNVSAMTWNLREGKKQ